MLSHILAWLTPQNLLAVAVLLAGGAVTAVLGPRARLAGPRGWYWTMGIAWCFGSSLWAAQFILALTTIPPQILRYNVWLTIAALLFALTGSAGMAGLLRARMSVAAAFLLGATSVAVQLTQLSGLPQTLGFGLLQLAATAAAGLGAGALFMALLSMTLASHLSWRAVAGLAGGASFSAAHHLTLYVQDGLLAGGVAAGVDQQVWLGTAVGVGALIQAGSMLLVDRVDARFEARIRMAWVDLEDTRARLDRESTQRRDMAAALAENEERFRSAFDEAATGMALISAEGKWLRVNRALCDFFGGYTPEELLRQSFVEVTHPDDVAVVQAGLQRLAAGEGEAFTHQVRSMKRDGSIAYGDVRLAVARRERGKVREFVGQVLDITARTRMEVDLAESESRFRSAFEDAAVAMALVGAEGAATGAFLRVNRALCDLLGYTAEELLRTNNQAVISREDVETVLVAAKLALEEAGPGGFQVETRYLRRDKQVVWVRLNVSLVRDAAGAPLYFIGQYEDITERKQAVEALQRANTELERNIRDQEREGQATHVLSEFGQLLQSCNDLAEAYAVVGRFGPRLLPGSAGQLYATPPSRDYLEQAVGWGSTPAVPTLFGMDQCWALRRGQPHLVSDLVHDLTCPHASGRPVVPSLCLPLVAQNDTLGVLWLEFPGATELPAVALRLGQGLSDRLALGIANLRLRQTLRDQSIRDLLTGLYNRRFLEESLTREIARASRSSAQLAVVMFDVDHFKRFNDLYGHDAGDRTLRAVGEVLLKHVRVSDVACRYGGEEFMLLLPDANLAAACERAQALAAAIASMSVQDAKLDAQITISAGVAVYPEHGKDPAGLVKAADEALYAAKAAGRNRVMGAQAA